LKPHEGDIASIEGESTSIEWLDLLDTTVNETDNSDVLNRKMDSNASPIGGHTLKGQNKLGSPACRKRIGDGGSRAAVVVPVVTACTGKTTESITGLLHDSGNDLPATIAPLPAAMDFNNLRRFSFDFFSVIFLSQSD
jgi:hypothetical protein